MCLRVVKIKDGDCNIVYFYYKVNYLKKWNYIKGLFDEEGVWKEEEKEVEKIVIYFYSNLFKFLNFENLDSCLVDVQELVISEMNEFLCKLYFDNEVWEVFLQMYFFSVLGLNGFYVVFNQWYWYIVGLSVVNYVNVFLSGVIDMRGVKVIRVVLILKVQ